MASPRAKKPAGARRVRPRGRIRYAVVGLGYIAQSAVLPAFRHARRNSELVALVSGDPRKRRALQRTYRARFVYDDKHYPDCLANPEIDAVYLALPNHLHRPYAVAAARAGKHVLCEKPLAVTEEDCEEMIAAAAENGVRLMTAYRLHFERTNLEAIEAIRSGRVGEPRIFQSSFTMQVAPGNVRLNPTAMGGGPIYDIGIYSINAARYLFRDEPTEAFAWTAGGDDRRFDRTPEMMACVLRFPGQRLASFVCSFGAADTGWYEVVGTKGQVRVEPAFETAEALTLRATTGGRTRRRTFPKRDHFAPELLAFSDAVRRGRDPEPSGREGLADVRIIRALLASARTGRPVRLAPLAREARPDLRMERRSPPVSKRRLIRAASPSRS